MLNTQVNYLFQSYNNSSDKHDIVFSWEEIMNYTFIDNDSSSSYIIDSMEEVKKLQSIQ